MKDSAAALHALTAGETAHFPDGSYQVNEKDPRQLAVVESDSPVPSGKDGCTEPLDSAHILKSTSDRVEIDVQSRCGGMLVLSDQYYPGWTATVNGEDATIHPTDVTFRGVSVPTGHSTVVFRYQPHSFRLGLVLFAAGVIALLRAARHRGLGVRLVEASITATGRGTMTPLMPIRLRANAEAGRSTGPRSSWIATGC